MIDWSYDLLSEAEQAMLRRVAVFAGGWTLSKAEDICSGDGIEATAVIGLLSSLVDKSLVVAEDHAGATRYRMLETVRQYALDRLQESGEQAHATEHLREEIDARMPFSEQADYQRAVAAAQAALGDDQFQRALNEGRAMPLEDAVQYALSGKETPHRH